MTKAADPAPVPEAVGKLYDRLTTTALKDGTFNENLHIGYWETPDSEASLEEAVVRLTDLLIAHLGAGEGDRVLDLGSGLGGPALQIVRRTGARVTGITVSEQQVKAATQVAADAGLSDSADFRLADAMDLPFEDGSFDAVIALESIIHMPDRERVLSEARRVLRPHGRVVLTDIFERAPIAAVRNPAIDKFVRNFMVTLADVDDYVAMLHRVGLRLRGIVDITEHTMQRTFTELSRPLAADRPEALGQSNLPDLFTPADMVGVEEFGCVLVVAEHP